MKPLRSLLQGAIQGLKHGPPKVLQDELHDRIQQTADDFPVMEYHAVLIAWLNNKVVIPPEDGGREEVCGEPQLTFACELGHRCRCPYPNASRHFEPVANQRILADCSLDLEDEGVPLGVMGKVGKNLPDPSWCGVDCDLSLDFVGHAATRLLPGSRRQPKPRINLHDSDFPYERKSPTRGRSHSRHQLNQREASSNRWRTDGNVRVGLEDSIYLDKGELAKTNADQVTRIRTILENLSLEIATPGRGARDAAAQGWGFGGILD